jgi:hypothetical protein
LQGSTERDVFAPDVLVNILIVAILPFAFYLFGPRWLPGLYLANALLALVFYFVARERDVYQRGKPALFSRLPATAIPLLIFVPIFFQVGSGIFHTREFIYDTGGMLFKLPIPVSVLACYLGIVLIGRFPRANLSLAMIFFAFVLMTMSTLVTSHDDPPQLQAKLILMMQYLLPMFALVLGQTYDAEAREQHPIAKAVVVVLWCIVPLQLLASLAQGLSILTSDLYLFSIHQHLQYVPVILVGGYLIALYELWGLPKWHPAVKWLGPLMGAYIVASMSMLAAGFGIAGVLVFVIHRMWLVRSGRVEPAAFFVTALLGGFLFVLAGFHGEVRGDLQQKFRLENVIERSEYWHYYETGILSDIGSFAFGHSAPPNRSAIPSAHNYYLDFVFNFGAVAMAAVLTLAVLTVVRLYRYRAPILASPGTLALAGVVLFLLFPDNLLKVGMRQPYPGIVTFFLWGVLLARLDALRATADQVAISRADSRTA